MTSYRASFATARSHLSPVLVIRHKLGPQNFFRVRATFTVFLSFMTDLHATNDEKYRTQGNLVSRPLRRVDDIIGLCVQCVRAVAYVMGCAYGVRTKVERLQRHSVLNQTRLVFSYATIKWEN